MAEKRFATAFLIVFITAGFFKVADAQAEKTNLKISSESSTWFNPFSVNSWVNLSSQLMKQWFPLFQQQYYPSYLQKPTTTRPPSTTKNQTEATIGTNKPKTDNIFGVLPDKDAEYLPGESEIEW